MTDSDRRRLLLAAGTAGAVLTAGCLSGDDDDDGDDSDDTGDDSDDTGDEPQEGTILGDITIDNVDTSSHVIHVLIDMGDEIVFNSRTDLSGQSSLDMDRDWPTDPENFRVIFILNDDRIREIRPRNFNEPDCLSLSVVIRSSSDLRIGGDPDEASC